MSRIPCAGTRSSKRGVQLQRVLLLSGMAVAFPALTHQKSEALFPGATPGAATNKVSRVRSCPMLRMDYTGRSLTFKARTVKGKAAVVSRSYWAPPRGLAERESPPTEATVHAVRASHRASKVNSMDYLRDRFLSTRASPAIPINKVEDGSGTA